jgi:hypothetical protein
MALWGAGAVPPVGFGATALADEGGDGAGGAKRGAWWRGGKAGPKGDAGDAGDIKDEQIVAQVRVSRGH